MIEFIIYDETKEINKIIETEIDKEMMNYDIDYKKEVYNSFSSKLKENIKNEKFKIFILNQTNISNSGLEVAKYIREEADDWKSIIIFISKINDYKYNILTKRLFILDYILIKDIKKQLKDLIIIGIKNYDSRPKKLSYIYKNNTYNISLRNIVYIEKEQENKRCIIHTNEEEYIIPSNLNNILSKLDKKFIKCSRSYIINLEQVLSYNKKDNIITFKNKKEVNEISRDKKQEIINYIRNV